MLYKTSNYSFFQKALKNIKNITICVYFAVEMVIQYYMVKQILLGNINSYFYVDSIATMLTVSPDNGITA